MLLRSNAIGILQQLPRARCVALLELSSSMDQAKQIHAQMITNALLRDTGNVARLIEKYCNEETSEGGGGSAQLIFRQATGELKNTLLWNVMLKYASPEESLRLFAGGEMMRAATPDHESYAYVLRSCARLRAMREGKQVHARALKYGLDLQLALATTCVLFYALCGDMKAARMLFEKMPEKSSASWNSMLTGYCVNGMAKEALLLFKEMVCREARSTESALLLLSACSQVGDLVLGATIHSRVLKTIPAPLDCPFIGTGLVDMYSKCGSLDNASALFHAMRRRNVITWSTMAAALAMHGQGKAVVELINLMENEGIAPNAITFTSLLSACCHAGLVEVGLRLFDEMQSRFNVVPAMQHYGCIVDLLGRAGMVEEAHEFIKNMPMQPDAVVWRALLGACKIHGEAGLGSKIGKILIGLKQRTEPLPCTSCEDFIALSNLYALAERWEEVHMVRTAMNKRGIQNKPGQSSVQNIDWI
ncbi:pentatricopeptide repeat-containing protein At3g18970-like [Phalaenopsis equestris]|uniref:pentatricopeptide repeat-containing protein At3g18970-like n=1 Tax=Phalaenopsis equestris TaxID=78828 RepID=UPI0009E2BBF3|nr:pentatricopeptide repeat-containing protein At3g18970-like [Phalaenopsis equestris]